jgi:hypothetical protein
VAKPREHGAALEQQASAESSVRDVAALGGLVDGLAVDVEKLGDLIGRQDHRGIVLDTHARHACDLGEVSPRRLAGSRVVPRLTAGSVRLAQLPESWWRLEAVAARARAGDRSRARSGHSPAELREQLMHTA